MGIMGLAITTAILIWGIIVYSKGGYLEVYGIPLRHPIVFSVFIIIFYVIDVFLVISGLAAQASYKGLEAYIAKRLESGDDKRDILRQIVIDTLNDFNSTRDSDPELKKEFGIAFDIIDEVDYKEAIEGISKKFNLDRNGAVLLYVNALRRISYILKIINRIEREIKKSLAEEELQYNLPSVRVGKTKFVMYLNPFMLLYQIFEGGNIKKGHLIISLNDKMISRVADLKRELLRYGPDDSILLHILYRGMEKHQIKQVKAKAKEIEDLILFDNAPLKTL